MPFTPYGPSRQLGGSPEVVEASAVPHEADDRVDAELSADVSVAEGVSGHFHSSFLLPEMTFTLLLEGSEGTALAHNFCQPALDNRITITRGDDVSVEKHGDRSSYTYQLEAFGRQVREGASIHSDTTDALEQATVMDACYVAADYRFGQRQLCAKPLAAATENLIDIELLQLPRGSFLVGLNRGHYG